MRGISGLPPNSSAWPSRASFTALYPHSTTAGVRPSQTVKTGPYLWLSWGWGRAAVSGGCSPHPSLLRVPPPSIVPACSGAVLEGAAAWLSWRIRVTAWGLLTEQKARERCWLCSKMWGFWLFWQSRKERKERGESGHLCDPLWFGVGCGCYRDLRAALLPSRSSGEAAGCLFATGCPQWATGLVPEAAGCSSCGCSAPGGKGWRAGGGRGSAAPRAPQLPSSPSAAEQGENQKTPS